MLNRIAASITLFGIISLTVPNIAVGSSNERYCQNIAEQKLQETDFGSKTANFARPIIVPVALPTVMDIIKRSNRGELNSFEDRQSEIRYQLEQKDSLGVVRDFDAVSYQAAYIIEPLLEDECRGVS